MLRQVQVRYSTSLALARSKNATITFALLVVCWKPAAQPSSSAAPPPTTALLSHPPAQPNPPHPSALCVQAGPSGMRIADLLDSINAQSSVRVSERDLRLALNELVSATALLSGYSCRLYSLALFVLCAWLCCPAPASPQALTCRPRLLCLQEDVARVQQGVVLLRA